MEERNDEKIKFQSNDLTDGLSILGSWTIKCEYFPNKLSLVPVSKGNLKCQKSTMNPPSQKNYYPRQSLERTVVLFNFPGK